MKHIIRQVISVLFIGVIISLSTTYAQEIKVKNAARGERTKIFTTEQAAIIKANRAKQIEFRKAFKATFSKSQLDILTNPKLIKADREKAFRASLTDGQVKMIKANRESIKDQRNALKTSLTDQQKMKIKRMAIKRFQNRRIMFMRASRHQRFYPMNRINSTSRGQANGNRRRF